MRKFGIDISRWQRGMDLEEAQAEGAAFVILRGAAGCDKDSCFEEFYRQAKALGLGVGCYQYSLAVTEEQARAEAQYLIDNVLRGRQFEYPIYMDCEDETQKALEKETVDAIIYAWCRTMEEAGYFAGVYTNGDFYRNYCSGAALSQRYTWWYAAWCADEIADYPMHQFGGETNLVRSNTVAGRVCDQDHCYVDFPAIIRAAGRNGYGDGEAALAAPEVQKNKEERTVTLTFNYLQLGDSGPQVMTLQALLNEFHQAGLQMDGGFGQKTLQAVMSYQRSRGLAVDGVVGPETWTQLLLK